MLIVESRYFGGQIRSLVKTIMGEANKKAKDLLLSKYPKYLEKFYSENPTLKSTVQPKLEYFAFWLLVKYFDISPIKEQQSQRLITLNGKYNGRNLVINFSQIASRKKITGDCDINSDPAEIQIFIPKNFSYSNSNYPYKASSGENSKFQEEVRSALTHELTHIFNPSEEPSYSKDTIEYLTALDEIYAYCAQAARMAERNKNISFTRALKFLILTKGSDLETYELAYVWEIYKETILTHKKLFNRYGKLLLK